MIWTKAGGRAGRPAVRVFTGVGGSAGGVVADAKPQTDALLVVEAVPGASGRAGLATNLLTSIGAISVTDASGLEVGDPVVRLTIQVPRAPTLADVKERLVMANGFENMQIDCLLDKRSEAPAARATRRRTSAVHIAS